MHRWSVEYLMLFNVEICRCVHSGHNNRHSDYFMGEDPIQTLHEEKDLGVIITDKLEPSSVLKRPRWQMLGMINRVIRYKTKEVVIQIPS